MKCNSSMKLFGLLAPLFVMLSTVSLAAPDSAEEIIFGGDATYPPFEWSSEGQTTGFNRDLAEAVANEMGVKAKHVLGSWPDAMQAIRSGKVDAVPMFWSASRSKEFLFTPPFLTLDHSVFYGGNNKKIQSISDLTGMAVAVEKFSFAHQQLQDAGMELDFVLSESTLDALLNVASGMADYAVLASLPAHHLIRMHRLDLYRTGPPLWPQAYAFAVRKDRPQLASRLTLGLASTFVNGRYDEIYSEWQHHLTPSSEQDEGVLIWPLTVGFVALSLVASIGIFWSSVLSRKVSLRTKLLNEELSLRERAEHKIKQISNYDADSELPNSKYFTELSESFISALPKGESPRKEIALIQLSDLSEAVGSFGYEAGLSLVREFGKDLRSAQFDVTGHLGRGVFVVLAGSGEVKQYLEKVWRPENVKALDASSSMRAGMSRWPEHGESIVELMRRAETALAHAISCNETWVEYSPSLEPDKFDIQIIKNFRLNKGEELYPVFQPQIDLDTGEIVAAEALVRWESTELGLIPPVKFIPLLERAGLIAVVTEKMINEAVRTAACLRREGIPCPISVNVSASDLMNTNIVDIVSSALGRYQGRPDDLKVELTETGVAENPEKIIDVLSELWRLGVSASVDDFGTGYASLSYLSMFPIQEVKIDRMFVQDMLINQRNLSIVRSTISMGQGLGLVVVAEGVEDLATLEALRHAGCDNAQGFFISRPLDEAGFIDFLRLKEAANPEGRADQASLARES